MSLFHIKLYFFTVWVLEVISILFKAMTTNANTDKEP